MNELSLYLHIPFCTEKCDYCDFFSVPLSGIEKSRKEQEHLLGSYIDALLYEIEQSIKETQNAKIPSVYIGGGTPSLLGGKGIARLLEGIKDCLHEAEVSEITVEANPETADYSFLSSCKDNGVTRLSLGVQSFDETVLSAAGRRGRLPAENGRNTIENSIYEAKNIFGKGLSLDVMSGLPGQTAAVLKNDIEKVLGFNPGHISLYSFTLEEGTPLALKNKKHEITAETNKQKESPDDLWLIGKDILKKAGFLHYEISNFASSSAFRSLHNIRYWLMKNWIGIGPSASGTIISGDTGTRKSYPPNIKEFISAFKNRKRPPVIEEKLDRKTLLKETLMMGYRYCEGPDPCLFFRRFGRTIEETIPQTLLKWQALRGDCLTDTIMTFLNSFLLDAFMELDT